MPSYRMEFSEDLLNYFTASLIEGLDAIQSLWFDLNDGNFFVNVHGKKYVNYALRAQFYVLEVNYSTDTQIIKFKQLDRTDVRGRFPMGNALRYLTDKPLQNYMTELKFVSYQNSVYTFNLRDTDTMKNFFDTELTGYRITELFPIDELKIHSDGIEFFSKSNSPVRNVNT